ncbi:MAG: hypothetical protein PHW83_09405 [Bacteroidales bacterium]|nr:hypothetical protein [Bacteroidales bacterium]
MALSISTTRFDTQSLSDLLINLLPDCKTKILNKSTVIVTKGKLMSVVRIKKDKLTVNGDLNTKDPVVLILIVLGILCGVIGVIFFAGILYIIYAKAIKLHKNKVYSLLKDNA